MSRPRFVLSVVALATVTVSVALSFVACTSEDEVPEAFRSEVHPPVSAIPAPLAQAHCEILVEGVGTIDMETDYLPHVITCENGGANLEALKAQAIAARSVAYYYVENQGSVCDSQGCQVYSCQNEPNAAAYQAVAETAGLYAMYSDTLTYTFYVAGDNGVSPPACVGNPNVGTEGWVTYNEGQSGTNVTQTELGWVHDPGDPGYGQNRGCMSQWGARCLENNNGYDYLDILRFYYGEDIEIVQAQGECIEGGGDGDGDGDPDPDPSTTTTTTGEPSGDGDGDPDPSTTGEPSGDGDGDACSIGAEDCPCTMGGGCDPGLVCDEGICLPEPSDTLDESGEGGLTSAGDPGGLDRGASEGCSCAAGSDPAREGLGGLAALAMLGLLAPLRRRR